MSFSRRQVDRRRRVLMTSASATAANPSPATRARMAELRGARRPTVTYGSRVRHCLRGRWFSLVPVQRKSLAKLCGWLLFVVVMLVIANDATRRFVAIADRPQFVDVFQIARHGSIGRYFIGVMYLALAGTGWMVYQIRRFRNDDFSGNYRVWQWIVGLALASSIATLVPLLAMLGASVEWVMGKRIALSGQDWIGLFLIIGGAILAMRSVAEMWRYRACVALLLCGWICTAIPIAVDWNVLTTQTNLRWTVVTSAPLLAVFFWFAASVSYLRLLYREVRGIAPASGFLERFRAAVQQRQTEREAKSKAAPATAKRAPATATSRKRATAPAPDPAETNDEEDREESSEKPSTRKRRWRGLRRPAKPTPPRDSSTSETDSEDDTESTEQPSTSQSSSENDDIAAAKKQRRWWPRWRRASQPRAGTADEESGTENEDLAPDADNEDPAPAKRRFGLGSMLKRKSAKAAPEADDSSADEDAVDTAADNDDPAPAKRRFGLGSMLKRKPAKAAAETDDAGGDDDAADTDTDNGDPAPAKRRFGLGSMMKRKSAKAADDANESTPAATSGHNNRSSQQDDESYDDDGDEDDSQMSDDDVDWSSLNKAERRKMRKQLKRSGRAA